MVLHLLRCPAVYLAGDDSERRNRGVLRGSRGRAGRYRRAGGGDSGERGGSSDGGGPRRVRRTATDWGLTKQYYPVSERERGRERDEGSRAWGGVQNSMRTSV